MRLLQVKAAPPVSTKPAANLPPVSTTPTENLATGTTGVIDTGGKFATDVNDRRQIATGINDTGGKFATSVNNTRGK
jgi:hypothetical protein